MKKFMAFTIALLFLTAMASALFAAETTFKGEYQVRAWAEWNFDKKPGYNPLLENVEPRYDGWFDQRFRLTITHERSEFLKAVVRLDLVDDTWGQQRNFRINNTIAGNYIDWAYIDFTLPKIGTFTVGKQPITFGYGLLLGNSGGNPGLDGVKWQNSWGPVTAAAMWFKTADNVVLGGGSKYYNRDASLWALDIKVAPNDKHLVELFGGMLLADSTRVGAGMTWHGAWNVPAPADLFGFESNWTLGFVGLAYTGNIANMIDIKFENSWIFGGMNYNTGYLPPGMTDDSLSVEGWNVYFDVSYYNDLLRVGVAFLMGSGAKHNWGPASLRNINMTNLREDDFAWANIIGNGYGGANSVYLAPGFGDNAENLTSVKLYFTINPMEKLSLNAAVVWAKWTDPVGSGANVATEMPAYPHPVAWYSIYGAPASWDASTDLGWEIDLGLSYEIMEGLTYSLAAGVLFTGDSFDYVGWDGTREDWGPIWSISNVLRYTF